LCFYVTVFILCLLCQINKSNQMTHWSVLVILLSRDCRGMELWHMGVWSQKWEVLVVTV